jgi:serine protease Do
MTALVVLFTIASTSRLLAQDHTVASVFAALKPSLAIVLAGASAGTAFCVSSDASGSYFLTNAHVVKSATNVILFLQFPRFRKVTGVVVARGIEESPDLAIIRVNDAKVPSVRLWTGTPSEGEPIANAGYPSAQYTFAQISGQLTPSVHLGTISAIANRGGLIEFDAQTLPGNSGGPLFDPRTGDVVGVVTWKLKETTDANVAIGVGRTVIPFLTQNRIVYTPVKPPTVATSAAAPISQPSDAPAPEILRTLPGAGTVAILYDSTRTTGEGSANAIQSAASDFATKFSRRFNVRAMPIDVVTSDAQQFDEAVRTHGALIGASYGAAFHVKRDMSNQYGRSITWSFDLRVGVRDIYGTPWAGVTKDKDALSARSNYDAILSSLADLNDQVIEELYQQLLAAARSEGGITNLFRYALPIGNGDHRTFVSLRPSTAGATAALPDFSVAAEAGLQNGDAVISVNGVPTTGKSQAELLAIYAPTGNVGAVDLVVQTADGKQQHIKFEGKDLRWYVERRAAKTP